MLVGSLTRRTKPSTDRAMSSTNQNLLHRAQSASANVPNRVTAQQVGWQYLNMEVRRLRQGETWDAETADFEQAFVMLGGVASFTSGNNTWESVGRRPNVFSGMPHAIYLSRNSPYLIRAVTDCEIATCWVPTDEDHPSRCIRPQDCAVEIRGGGNATRQINSIIPPGFDCHRIVCVEVFTPGGNWSSYPPHKHDVHIEVDGTVKEAELEEFYYYKIRENDGANGYAVQRVYTGDRTLDFVGVAHDNDIIVVPRGYHPVSAAVGYDCYYLNFLAGSAQSLANTDDPDYAWIKEAWPATDPRVPLVTLEMETR